MTPHTQEREAESEERRAPFFVVSQLGGVPCSGHQHTTPRCVVFRANSHPTCTLCNNSTWDRQVLCEYGWGHALRAHKNEEWPLGIGKFDFATCAPPKQEKRKIRRCCFVIVLSRKGNRSFLHRGVGVEFGGAFGEGDVCRSHTPHRQQKRVCVCIVGGEKKGSTRESRRDRDGKPVSWGRECNSCAAYSQTTQRHALHWGQKTCGRVRQGAGRA